MIASFLSCSRLDLRCHMLIDHWRTALRAALLSWMVVCGHLMPVAAADTVTIHGNTQVDFASVDVARDILAKRDGFIRRMSAIDRQLRLGSNENVDEERFLRYVREQVTSWNPDEITTLTGALGEIAGKLEPIKVSWPQRIHLIKTTGREESGAAYCRQAAIVLPQSVVQRDPKSLERLLLHELFHILSANAPDLRSELYQIVGFTVCPDIPLPDELQPRKITNPDAPAINCIMTLNRGHQELVVAPVLFSRRPTYESVEKRSIFSELQFRLMVVQPEGETWRAALTADGQPQLLNPEDQPSFRAQIGRNTKYIIHPEEILADNFVHWVLKSEDLPDRWIIEQMGRKLEQR